MTCEHCADTRIDQLTLRRMNVEVPCRYCEIGIQPDRVNLSDMIGIVCEAMDKGDDDDGVPVDG